MADHEHRSRMSPRKMQIAMNLRKTEMGLALALGTRTPVGDAVAAEPLTAAGSGTASKVLLLPPAVDMQQIRSMHVFYRFIDPADSYQS